MNTNMHVHHSDHNKVKSTDLDPGLEITFANSYDHLGHQESAL